MPVDEEEDRCNFEAAVFHPLADDDPGLAARLSARFLQRLMVDMTPSERTYAEEWPPPQFDIGITPRGGRVLAVAFGGGRSITDWDGSDVNAEEIIDSCAETNALNSEWDYWVQGGGWKEWKGDGPPS